MKPDSHGLLGYHGASFTEDSPLLNYPPFFTPYYSLPMHRSDANFLHVPGDPLLGLTVNLPAALSGQHLHGLPPYAPIPGYAVDEYEECPGSWPRTAGLTASYFVGVKEGHGMWLDFNRVRSHDRHVAVVVSIQGINPLTGRKTDTLNLEKYPDDPSVEEWLRGYQNYLSTSATPSGMMWIDGFRGEDGKVRQYVFTKDESRGVAAQLIGEDRVFAIGAAFFVSKDPKPVKERGHAFPGAPLWLVDHSYLDGSKGITFGSSLVGSSLSDTVKTRTSTKGSGVHRRSGLLRSYVPPAEATVMPSSLEESAFCNFVQDDVAGPQGVQGAEGDVGMQERLEIAAGEEISQRLYRDHNPLDFWLPDPAGVVVVNYAPEAVVAKILAGKRAKPKAGFLDKVVVGNPK